MTKSPNLFSQALNAVYKFYKWATEDKNFDSIFKHFEDGEKYRLQEVDPFWMFPIKPLLPDEKIETGSGLRMHVWKVRPGDARIVDVKRPRMGQTRSIRIVRGRDLQCGSRWERGWCREFVRLSDLA